MRRARLSTLGEDGSEVRGEILQPSEQILEVGKAEALLAVRAGLGRIGVDLHHDTVSSGSERRKRCRGEFL